MRYKTHDHTRAHAHKCLSIQFPFFLHHRLHGPKGWRVDFRAQMRREREEEENAEIAALVAENARLRAATAAATLEGQASKQEL